MSAFLSIERLGRDIWMAVTNIFYDVLHTLEEEGLLDPANSLHMFSTPLRMEGNRSPNQMWEIGLIQNPVDPPESEVITIWLNLFCARTCIYIFT